MSKTDKRDRARRFRTRLIQAMQDGDVSQSALARATGSDRSTISQLLAGDTARLPNAHLAAECAAALGVSSDWLLGLSDRPETATDILSASMEVSEATRDQADQQIFDWLREAEGYKIRHVPAHLPDLLKTPEMLEWEYTPNLAKTTEQAIGASGDRLDLLTSTPSDYEIAIPLFEIESLVRGDGYYMGLPEDTRQAQVDRLLDLHERLYPKLRLFLFDARQLFSVPITIFGPLLAALYLGQKYLIYRDTERVALLSGHFDQLVREATVSDRSFPDYVARLRS